jgi:hypothetical protein
MTLYALYIILYLCLAGCEDITRYHIEVDIEWNREYQINMHYTEVWKNNDMIHSWGIPIDNVTCEAIKNNRMKADSLIIALNYCQ